MNRKARDRPGVLCEFLRPEYFRSALLACPSTRTQDGMQAGSASPVESMNLPEQLR